MSALEDELGRLLDFLDRRGHRPPTRRLRIVEVPYRTPIDQRGRIRVQRSGLCEPGAYEARFDELLAAGLPWLNMSCYGALDDTLIVAVELPMEPSKPAAKTSVNLSGPPAAVLSHGWNADQVLSLE
jgi:hypothetical protein